MAVLAVQPDNAKSYRHLLKGATIMQCPVCQSDSKVLDTRWIEEENSIRRKRECIQCSKRFVTYEKIEDSATEENVKKVTMKKTGDGNYTNLQCTFHIDTPTDATWYASFISGDINSFEFVGANSGPVGEAATLTIKAKNSTITSSQMANLDIVIRTADGRTLKSSELTNGVTYQLVQNE